jgi:hypothetical protein
MEAATNLNLRPNSLAIKIIDEPVVASQDEAPHTAVESNSSHTASPDTAVYPRKIVSISPELEKRLSFKPSDKDLKIEETSPRSSTGRKSTSYQGDRARQAALQRRDDDTRRMSVAGTPGFENRLSVAGADRRRPSVTSSNGSGRSGHTPTQERRVSLAPVSQSPAHGGGRSSYFSPRNSYFGDASRASVLSQQSVVSQRTRQAFSTSQRPAIRLFPRAEVVIVDKNRFSGDQDSIFQTEGNCEEEEQADFDIVPEFADVDEGHFVDPQAYFEYLMMSQRHSTTFQSGEILYHTGKSTCKFIGPNLLGDIIGKGAL